MEKIIGNPGRPKKVGNGGVIHFNARCARTYDLLYASRQDADNNGLAGV